MNEPRAAIDRRLPREAWRNQQPIWSDTAVTTAVLPWRAASDAHASASREERAASDTDASASRDAKQSRRDSRVNYRWQDDVLAAVHGAWHIAPLCQLLVCGVHGLDGTETHEDMFEENAQTEARDACCLHASEIKQSTFPSHYQGDVHTGLGQRGLDPRQGRQNLSHDGLRRSRSFGISASQ